MKRIYKITAALLVLMLALSALPGAFAPVAEAATDGKWITTWGSSLVNGSISVGSISLNDLIPGGSTIRTELPVTTDGSKLKFTFSNQYGSSAVTINEASVAQTDGNGNAAIIDGTQMPITFRDGETSITIPAGGYVVSDAIEMKTSALEYISISLYFASPTYMTSTGLSNGRTFMRVGFPGSASRVNDATLPLAGEVNLSSSGITYHTIPFLERIDSLASGSNAATAVFIGDSTLVNDSYLHYAQRLVSAGVKNVSVVNEAIVGNKLLSDGSGLIGNLYGQALIDRFQRDVLNLAGVKYCFVKIGLNDILHQFSLTLGDATPKHSPDDIIAGYRTLINLCHKNGIKIYFFTKTAWKGYERNFLGSGVDIEWNEEMQAMCDRLTEWVKTNNEADGFIDASPLADPSDPVKLCSTLTLDGAHLTDLGAIALADLIPLSFVGVNKEGKTSAQLAGVDPYAEKKQILASMNPPTSEEPSDEPSSAPESTTAPDTTAPDTTAPPESTTLPPAQEPDSYTVFAPDESTENYTEPTYEQPTPPAGQDVNYVVSDDNTSAGSIGDGSNIGFLLVFVVVVAVSLTMVALTLTRKREN